MHGGEFGGWSRVDGLDTAAGLAAMFAAPAPAETLVAVGDGLGMLGGRDGDSAAEDGYHAAIVGQPRWSDPELAKLAGDRGHAIALIHAYRHSQRDLLGVLQGRFALALRSSDGSESLLAVDRLGSLSVCFMRYGDGILFANRADAVRALAATLADSVPALSEQALYDYVYFHVVPIPESAFTGIERLGPGECLHVREDTVSKVRWHQTAYRPRRNLDFADAKQEFRALIDTAVGEFVQDDRQVGAFLSGGTDSSTLAGTLGKVSGAPPRCFSIGFDAPGFDEVEYARLAAKRFDAEHHVYYIRPSDIVEAIPEIARFSDAPFGNSSVVPAWFCARMAREQDIDLLLGGDGGDELFGGNERYGEPRLYRPWERTPSALRKLIEVVVNGFPAGDSIWPIRKARAYIEAARIPMPDRTQRYTLLHRLGAERVLHPDFLARVDQQQPAELLREVYWGADCSGDLNRYLAMDMKVTLADNDLPKVNTACTIAGVDVAYPLLDDRLVEFAATLPDDFKLRDGRLRWFFKEALTDFLPHEIIHKSKHGFGLPFGLWMNEHAPLRELVDDSLTTLKERGIVNPDFIDALLGPLMREHASYYGVAVWILVMLEQWMRVHVDS